MDWNLKMIVSRCCKELVYVVHDYYVCEKCHVPCMTTFSLNMDDEYEHDATGDVC
jgi:hypothetical protein